MTASGYALFDTAIGRCGAAWSARGLVRVLLPEESAQETRTRLRKESPEAAEAMPPREVRRAIELMQALLAGRRVDLSAVPLDMDGVPSFNRRVYEAARTIPAGATLSYGEVAERAGKRGAARAVGQALGRNPFPIVVPCHRVLAAGGRMGGFSAPGGVRTKARLLSIERVATANDVGQA